MLIFFQLSPEGASVHTQKSCRYGLVAAAFPERLLDLLIFSVFGEEPHGGGQKRIADQRLSINVLRIQRHGQLLRRDRIRKGVKHTDPFGNIAKLPDVAWKWAGQKELLRLRRQGGRPGYKIRLIALQHVQEDQKHVSVSLSQRRKKDPEYIQTIEQILPETAFTDQTLQISIGGAYDTHVDGDDLVVSQPSYLPFLKYTKELALHIDGLMGNMSQYLSC